MNTIEKQSKRISRIYGNNAYGFPFDSFNP